MPDKIINPNTREIDGKLYSWQPSNQLDEIMRYQGLSREDAGKAMGLTEEQLANYDQPGDSATGSWVPSSYKNEKGTLFGPKWMLPAMIGGPALAAGIGGAIGGGAAAGGAGGAGATTAATGGGAAATGGGAAAITGGGAATGGGGAGGAGGFLGSLFGGGGGAGGTTGTILRGVGTAGEIAGNISANRAAGRQAEANNAVASNREDLLRAQAEQEAGINAADVDLARKKYAIDVPRSRAGQVAVGDILKNIQDVHMNIAGIDPSAFSVTGGMRPSLLGDLSRQAGGELSRQALDALLTGKDTQFEALPKFTLPEKMTAPEPGKLDKALNILGTVGAFTGAVPKRTPTAAPTSTGYGSSPGGYRTIERTITRPRGGAF